MVSRAVLIRTFSSGIHTHPVSWNCAYHLRMELSDGGCFPNLVRNCRWTILPRHSFWITLYIRYFIVSVPYILGRSYWLVKFTRNDVFSFIHLFVGRSSHFPFGSLYYKQLHDSALRHLSVRLANLPSLVNTNFMYSNLNQYTYFNGTSYTCCATGAHPNAVDF